MRTVVKIAIAINFMAILFLNIGIWRKQSRIDTAIPALSAMVKDLSVNPGNASPERLSEVQELLLRIDNRNFYDPWILRWGPRLMIFLLLLQAVLLLWFRLGYLKVSPTPNKTLRSPI